MSSAGLYYEVLAEAQSDGTALNTSTTPTSILPTHARATILPTVLRHAGKTLHVFAAGRASCMNPTPGNLTLDFRLGPTSNIVVFNGGAVAHSAMMTLMWAVGITVISAPLAVARFRNKT